MTQSQKLIRAKLSLLELGKLLNNVSEACRVSGVSRQHFYDIKKAYEEGGVEALAEQTRRNKPLHKNRVSQEVEDAVVAVAQEFPAFGQVRAANELRQRGIHISGGGVRGVWLRHGLETFKKRLKRLEEIAAKEGTVLTEAQVQALEKARTNRQSDPDEIETHHPGYLISQDTMYVGYIKGVGRIYQQTVLDTHSSVAFAKLYDTKTPLTAADCLNDRVLPFFEQQQVDVLRVLTDRGTEYCGREDTHPYQLFLGLQDIEHTRTKVRHPQTNGICERFHQTVQNEFYRVVFRKRIYTSLEELQADLDEWVVLYNEQRTHQGKRCKGRTPMQTFAAGRDLALSKRLEPKTPPPRMDSNAYNSSEAAAASAVLMDQAT